MGIEVRLKFADPQKALEKLGSVGKITQEYETTDVFFQPKGESWNFEEKNMRLRRNVGNSEDKVGLIYREVAWNGKNKTFKVEWKFNLPSDLEKSIEIVKSWGLQEIIRYNKKGKLFEISSGDSIYYEDIEHIGPLAEIEEETREEVDLALSRLLEGIEYKIVSQSVPSLVKEKLGL